MGKVSKLARSHKLFIDFLNVSVLSDTVVYSAIPYEKIKAYHMFLRRSLVHISYMYMIFVYVGTFGGLPLPPPPPYQKAGYAVASFRSPEEWPNEDGRFRPPHSLHEIATTAHDIHVYLRFLIQPLRDMQIDQKKIKYYYKKLL